MRWMNNAFWVVQSNYQILSWTWHTTSESAKDFIFRVSGAVFSLWIADERRRAFGEHKTRWHSSKVKTRLVLGDYRAKSEKESSIYHFHSDSIVRPLALLPRCLLTCRVEIIATLIRLECRISNGWFCIAVGKKWCLTCQGENVATGFVGFKTCGGASHPYFLFYKWCQ